MLETANPRTTTPTDPALPFRAWKARVDRALDTVLPPASQSPQPLHQAMRHAVFAGGKRLRPLLVLAAGNSFGCDAEALDQPACAVELIHTYSLIHDDLPAMDDDQLRRGRPTCHVVFGEAMAILAGDALQALAFETLARDAGSSASHPAHAHMVRCLGSACGSGGMAGGQALDLAAVGQTLDLAALEHMHRCKTGALIRASVRLGAMAAGCSDAGQLDLLDEYADSLGLAFQVRDDILDVEGDTGKLGKTPGKDARHAKPAFPSVIGMQASRQHLARLVEQANGAIASLGAHAQALRELARYAAERTR